MEYNKNRRYRLKDTEVVKLGLTENLRNRYRLSKEQERTLAKLREGQHVVKRLFFDIETSAMIVYTWRTGWNLTIGTDNIIEDWKIICISYKWEGEDKVHTLDWGKERCDKKLLDEFIKIANTADELVGHNGDRFDLKKIRTRCIFHRIPMFPHYRTLDTLKKAKSGFNFNSNKLDYIAKFLGVGAKLEHEGFNMWVKCMKGDEEALKKMIEYWEMDIVVLEDVFFTMQNYIKPNVHAGVLGNNLKYSCPVCGSENVEFLNINVTPLGTIKRLMQCKDCGHTYEISNSSYMNYLKFKAENVN
jgi:predicted PolB exonuclease-like 3'-5' exonuclease/rubredoxin